MDFYALYAGDHGVVRHTLRPSRLRHCEKRGQ
jgi:hypothetical protein